MYYLWKGQVYNMQKGINKMKFGFTIVMALTIALTLSLFNGKTSFGNFLGNSIVHAATGNILETDEILTQFLVSENDSDEHWSHTLSHDGKILLPDEDFDTTDLKYIVKLPDELSHLLEDSYVLDYLTGEVTNFGTPQNAFFMRAEIIDKDGNERVLYRDDNSYEYLTINKETNSIEFDVHQFLTDNEFELPIKDSLSDGHYINLGFDTPFVIPFERILDNGTYEFKTALIHGPAIDLDNLTDAYSLNLEIDYSTDPEPEPEPEPEVDKSELQELVDDTALLDEEAYTEESFEAVTEAVASAEEVLANEDATQEDVDDAVAVLQTAIDALEEKTEPEPVPEPEVDKTALQELVDEVASMDEDAYTEESFQAVKDAVASAQEVLANEDATQEDVDNAVAALQAAIDSLEEILIVDVEDDNGTDEENDDTGNKLPETATPHFNMLLIGFIAIFAGIGGLVFRKIKLVK